MMTRPIVNCLKYTYTDKMFEAIFFKARPLRIESRVFLNQFSIKKNYETIQKWTLEYYISFFFLPKIVFFPERKVSLLLGESGGGGVYSTYRSFLQLGFFLHLCLPQLHKINDYVNNLLQAKVNYPSPSPSNIVYLFVKEIKCCHYSNVQVTIERELSSSFTIYSSFKRGDIF